MTDADMQFLMSYAKVMKPIALAMTLLQGESTMYLGNLIPTIMGIKCKLQQSTDRVVEPLVKALLAGIDRRFQATLNDNEHLIASVLHPQFKLNFLPEEARLNFKRMVLTYITEVANELLVADATISGEIHSPAAVGVKEDEDDLYSFMNPVGQQAAAGGNKYSAELDEYLASKPANVDSLTNFSNIAKAFIKANSTLPSSAAVERLFSTAGMILSPRRCKMTDKLFDQMVFLKCRAKND